ncbi:MAG: substrate-binding domain-containing protein [Clostridium sp.]|nr:substrate-binding domain-containing protein [uncultured Enterocloster sp.]
MYFLKAKVTIRDVAAKAGVSISSVHFALSGKAGVSDETREKVRRTAEELGYQPNTLASSLKRSTQRIAILVPAEDGGNRYYYPPMWRGIHDYLSTINVNMECIEMPYHHHGREQILEQLKKLTCEHKLHGILTVGHIDEITSKEDWRLIQDEGISVVCITSELKLCDYLCCIQPEYEVIGRTMAELIISRIPEFGSIFICGGNPKWEAHSAILRGFKEYLSENRCPNLLYIDHSWTMDKANYVNIFNQITRPDVAACCSVYSQGTIMLGEALEESGRAGRLFAVGSDLSDATADRLRHSVFNNVIQKNPYAQGYIGIRTLAEYLISGKLPEQKRVYVGSDVVFKSNLVMYEHENYRCLFL